MPKISSRTGQDWHSITLPPPPPPPLWFCRRRTSPFSYRAYAQDKENRISPGVVHKAGSHLVILIDAMKKTGGPNPDSCHSMHIQIIHNSDNRQLSKLLLIRNNQLPIASRNQHKKWVLQLKKFHMETNKREKKLTAIKAPVRRIKLALSPWALITKAMQPNYSGLVLSFRPHHMGPSKLKCSCSIPTAWNVEIDEFKK